MHLKKILLGRYLRNGTVFNPFSDTVTPDGLVEIRNTLLLYSVVLYILIIMHF